MGIRDQEIKRLEQYSRGLGLPVVWEDYKPYSKSYGAAVVLENDKPIKLVMKVWKGKSKTQIILDFIHELAHHLSWIYNGRKDPESLRFVLNKQSQNLDLTKDERRVIYEMEKWDSQYRKFIYNEVGIKINYNKVEIDRKLDIWGYRYWWLYNKMPTKKQFEYKRYLFESQANESQNR